ncbi:MAG: electron transfer flavoprotein subunit alpha/FixB family protein [candidate division WOR-3 bacterium]
MLVWLIFQQDNGVLEFSSRQVLTFINHLKERLKLSAYLNAIILGPILDSEFEVLLQYGVDEVFNMENLIHSESVAFSITRMLTTDKRQLIVADNADFKLELCARISCLIGCPFISNIIDLENVDEKGFYITRSIYMGKLWEKVWVGDDTIVVSLDEEALPEPHIFERQNKTLQQHIGLPSNYEPKSRLIERKQLPLESVPLERARIVVSGGRGMGKDGFPLLERLSKKLKGSLGGTRPMVDEMVIPFDRQIGQTGKTVRPLLIINAGISGANEYTMGMDKARYSIAINTDPHARIFEFADLAVEGDCKEIIKLLIEKLDDQDHT